MESSPYRVYMSFRSTIVTSGMQYSRFFKGALWAYLRVSSQLSPERKLFLAKAYGALIYNIFSR